MTPGIGTMDTNIEAKEEWTSLLFEIANEINTGCLVELKFLMKDRLSASERQGIVHSLDLMNILETKDLVSIHNCSYLVKMLNKAKKRKLADRLEEGRKEIVQKYGMVLRYLSRKSMQAKVTSV